MTNISNNVKLKYRTLTYNQDHCCGFYHRW